MRRIFPTSGLNKSQCQNIILKLGKRKLELQYTLLNKTCVIITLMQKENLEGFS